MTRQELARRVKNHRKERISIRNSQKAYNKMKKNNLWQLKGIDLGELHDLNKLFMEQTREKRDKEFIILKKQMELLQSS